MIKADISALITIYQQTKLNLYVFPILTTCVYCIGREGKYKKVYIQYHHQSRAEGDFQSTYDSKMNH